MSDLTGKRILITGGTRGIGLAIARQAAHDGAAIALTGRDQASCDKVADEIAQMTGSSSVGLAAQLDDDVAVETLVSRAATELGGIDVLINNAGVDADGPALGHGLDDWRRVLRINLEVPFRLAKQAAQYWVERKRGGAIINVSSVAGFKALPDACSYVASKHGLVGLTKALALEWGPHDIRVCGIAPGLIKTDMTEYLWSNEAGAAYVKKNIPLQRIGLPEDIGALTAFLASDKAGFIHGETIISDGGSLAS